MQVVTKDTFKTEVLGGKGLVLVDFYAESCGPCKVTSPILDSLSQDLKDIKFVIVDVDANPELVSEYSIFSIPTFLLVKNGAVVSQFSGAMPKEGFLAEIKKVS